MNIKWSGGARGAWAVWAGIALVLLGAVLIAVGRPWQNPVGASIGGAVCVLAAALVIIFVKIRVTVTRERIRVDYWPFLAWPRTIVPLATVRSVRAIDVNPIAHGGWGYRGSRRISGRAAIILRAGPAIQLALTDGTTLTVTVDDAEACAATIRRLTT